MKKLYARDWAADGEYTFRCIECRDTGYVRAFSPKAMRDAVEHVRGTRRQEDIRLSFCDVPCGCSSGDDRSQETHAIIKKHHRDESVPPPMRATDSRCVKADPLLRVSDLVARLTQWATAYQQMLDTQNAKREAPYQAFDAFNNGVDF